MVPRDSSSYQRMFVEAFREAIYTIQEEGMVGRPELFRMQTRQLPSSPDVRSGRKVGFSEK
jgi:hypothetical protein